MSANSWAQTRGQGKVRVRKQLWYKGPDSRADIADALSLSTPAVTQIINTLIASGEVIESQRPNTKNMHPGRHPATVDIVPEAHYFIGIEMRRDSRHICLTDYRGNVIDQAGEESSYREYEENLEAVARLANAFIGRLTIPAEKIHGLCVGLPGVVDADRRLLVSHQAYGCMTSRLPIS